VKIKIPTPLYSYTNHEAFVDAKGSTLEELTRDLDKRYPGIRFRIVDEQNEIRPHVKFFLNGKQTFDLNAAVSEKDQIAIVQAFSGG
jgi:molybdopterin converting factor small subunit